MTGDTPYTGKFLYQHPPNTSHRCELPSNYWMDRNMENPCGSVWECSACLQRWLYGCGEGYAVWREISERRYKRWIKKMKKLGHIK